MASGTNVRVLHRQFGGVFTPVFTWNTKKTGTNQDVALYLFGKFRQADEFPKGYEQRPLEEGDRIELHDLDANEVRIYEVTDYCTIQEI